MKANIEVSSAAITYVGGQSGFTNVFLKQLFSEMRKHQNFPCKDVYGITYGYKGMSEFENYQKLSGESVRALNDAGNYLKTCRNADPSSDLLFPAIISHLKRFNIHYLFVIGGDGGARGALDFADKAKETGYPVNLIFIPATIDGINGSDSTLGFKSASRYCAEQAESLFSNAFNTYDSESEFTSRIGCIEIPGRDRNDLLISVADALAEAKMIYDYPEDSYKILAVPYGSVFNSEKLIKTVSAIRRNSKIGIIVHEHAFSEGTAAQNIANIISGAGLGKVNCTSSGYLAQTSTYFSDEIKEEYAQFAKASVSAAISSSDSFGIAKSVVIQQKQFSAIELKNLVYCNKSENILSENRIKESFHSDIIVI